MHNINLAQKSYNYFAEARREEGGYNVKIKILLQLKLDSELCVSVLSHKNEDYAKVNAN